MAIAADAVARVLLFSSFLEPPDQHHLAVEPHEVGFVQIRLEAPLSG
jgi:hypothetical protein